jgi:hypothetical protein
MKRESLERIIQAYENVSALLGFPTLNSGLSYMCGELEKTLKKLRPVHNRAGLEAVLAKEPEPTREELEAQIKSIELFPYQMRRHIPQATKEAKKHLPHEPGGRPRAIKPQEYQDVRDAIGQLLARGTRLKIAQQRVAQRRGVSTRTVQRIWQQRTAIASDGDTEDI